MLAGAMREGGISISNQRGIQTLGDSKDQQGCKLGGGRGQERSEVKPQEVMNR